MLGYVMRISEYLLIITTTYCSDVSTFFCNFFYENMQWFSDTSAIMNGIAVNMQEDYNNARDSKLTIKIDLSKLWKSSKNYFSGLSWHRKFNLILAKHLAF